MLRGRPLRAPEPSSVPSPVVRLVVVSAHYPPNFVSGGTLQPQRLARAFSERGPEGGVYAGWARGEGGGGGGVANRRAGGRRALHHRRGGHRGPVDRHHAVDRLE